MKKLLALVLALVMTLGLATVGTSAAYSDFTDTADVSFEEAMKVMNAVGVFVGDNGKLDPKGNLTRAQAAKLVAYLALGEDIAEALPKTGSKFADVKDGAWYAGYVNYMVNEGYTTGTSETTFSPDGQLNGYQFGAFLLAVLGYDREIEGMVGNGWETKVAVKLEECGITDGVDKLGSAALTREEAAQFCLNALKATCVEYADKGTTVAIGDATIQTGAKKATPVTSAANNTIDNVETYNGVRTVQLGEKLYKGKLALTTSATGTDEFGRPSSVWTYPNVVTEVTAAPSTPVASFTAATSAANVAKALSGYKVWNTGAGGGYSATTTSVANAYTINNTTTYATATSKIDIDDGGDGVYYTSNTNGATAQSGLTVSGETIAKAIADETANGKLVEVYADSTTKIVTKIVAVVYTVEKVNGISTATSGNVTYSLSRSGSKIDYADEAVSDTIKLNGTVAKDDYVTTVLNKDGVLEVYPTTTITGAQSANSVNNATSTIGGTEYKIGTGVSTVKAPLANNYVNGTAVTGGAFDFRTNSTDEATYYLDQYGFLVAHEAIKTTTNYAIVDSIAAKNTTTGLSTGKKVEAVLVFPDASKQTVTIHSINGAVVTGSSAIGGLTVSNNAGAVAMNSLSTPTTMTIDDTAAQNTNVWANAIVTYTTEDDGSYNISYVAATNSTGAPYVATTDAGAVETLISKGVPAIGAAAGAANPGGITVSGNANTIYVVKTISNGSSKFTAYTGYENVPDIKESTAGTAIRAYYRTKDNVANGTVQIVYVNATANTTVGGDSSKVFYTKDNSITRTGTGTTSNPYVYEIKGILDGTAATIQSKAASNPANSANWFDVVGGPAQMAKKTFYSLTLDGNDYVTSAVQKTWGVTGNATGKSITNTMADNATEKSFDGYLIGENTKIYVIETDGTVSAGSYTDFIAGDTYYADLQTGGSASYNNTFKTVYIVREGEFAADNNVASIVAAFAAGNANVTVTGGTANGTADLTDVADSDNLVIGVGQTLTYNGDLTISDADFRVQGTLIVNGELEIAVTPTNGIEGTIIVNGNGTNNVGDLTISQAVTIKGDVTVEHNVAVSGGALTVDDGDDTNATNATLAVGGTLSTNQITAIDGGEVTVGKLTSTGAVTFTAAGTPALTITNAVAGGSTAGATTISGGTLTVNAGTLTLSGALIYAGNATVAGEGTVTTGTNALTRTSGILTVSGHLIADTDTAFADDTGTVVVEAGGILEVYGFSGTVANAMGDITNKGTVKVNAAVTVGADTYACKGNGTDANTWEFTEDVGAAGAGKITVAANTTVKFSGANKDITLGEDLLLPAANVTTAHVVFGSALNASNFSITDTNGTFTGGAPAVNTSYTSTDATHFAKD